MESPMYSRSMMRIIYIVVANLAIQPFTVLVYAQHTTTPSNAQLVDTMPLETFILSLKNDVVDLVILLERTRAVGRWVFNFQARKLVSYVLRYYTTIDPDNVRLVLATFANNFTVVIDGMRRPVNKCDIWKRYWDKVILIDTPGVWNVTNVRNAYQKTVKMFKMHGRLRSKKYVWILTSGDYKEADGIPTTQSKDALISEDVTILATKVTLIEGLIGQIRNLVNSDVNYIGDPDDWKMKLNRIAMISESTPYPADRFTSGTCYCDVFGFEICKKCISCPCSSPNEDCVCTSRQNMFCPSTNTPLRTCGFPDGNTGRHCDKEVLECVKYACANQGKCMEVPKTPRYNCVCTGNWDPELLCDGMLRVTGTPHLRSFTAVIVASVAGAVVLLVICLTVCIIYRRKKRTRHVGTNSVSTYTNPERRQTTTTTSTTTASSVPDNGDYLEIPDIPSGIRPRPIARVGPSVNLTRPRMIGRQGPPTPAKSSRVRHSVLGSMLAKIPFPLWSSTGQEEVTMPTTVVDNGGIVQDEHAIYENSGCSPSMKSWHDYLLNLTTTGGLKHFALIGYDRKAFSTTSTSYFLPSNTEFLQMYKVLSDKRKDVVISLQNTNYRVTRNDGRMLEAYLLGTIPDVLCIGLSKKFLTLGLMTDPQNSGDCYSEVKWVRDSLSREMK